MDRIKQIELAQTISSSYGGASKPSPAKDLEKIAAAAEKTAMAMKPKKPAKKSAKKSKPKKGGAMSESDESEKEEKEVKSAIKRLERLELSGSKKKEPKMKKGSGVFDINDENYFVGYEGGCEVGRIVLDDMVGGASVGGASVGGASVGGASVGGASVGGAEKKKKPTLYNEFIRLEMPKVRAQLISDGFTDGTPELNREAIRVLAKSWDALKKETR